jgi:iron complex outermembrane receptor protein
MQIRLLGVSTIALMTALSVAAPVCAQTTPAPAAAAAPTASSDTLQEIVVTARRQSENIQRVPDSITAFTADAITNRGIKNLGDLSQATPSLNFRDGRGFEANFFDLRLRGIGQAQGGWPAVAFIVDGIPAPSSDALTSGSLADVDRIEVLRGPQSALYGANAIAGAINIITKRPTDTPHAEARVYYGNGNDLQAAGNVSGPLVADKLYARAYVNIVSDDGRIDSATNGMHLDPTYSQHYETRFIFTPTTNFEADVKAGYEHAKLGFAFQDRVPGLGLGVNYLNDYRSDFLPRRDYAGRQLREQAFVSARLKYDANVAILTSATSFSHAHQTGKGTGCYDDVNSPGVFANADGSVTCLSNIVAYGNRAKVGQAIEPFQNAEDDFDTFYQDFRVSSPSGGPLSWLFGADTTIRTALDGTFTNYTQMQATGIGTVPISSRFDQKYDRWWGVYGQVGYTLGPWEATVAGRYDNQQYKDEGFTSAARIAVIRTSDPSGALVDTQVVNVNNFQPKGQLSYHFDSQRMAYVTISKGFRAGYFNTGSYGAPETTTNYEGGVKTQWLERRLQANASVFHIDYSNQQLSTTLLVPPYRVPVTVPQTKINGVEFEAAYLLFHGFTLSGNVSYLDAKVNGRSATIASGTYSPKSPRWSGNVGGQYNRPLWGDWVLNAHADVSFHDTEYLFTNNTQQIPANKFVNARIGVEKGPYGIYFVGQNLTDTKEDEMQAGVNNVYAARYRVEPRTYGVELRMKY